MERGLRLSAIADELSQFVFAENSQRTVNPAARLVRFSWRTRGLDVGRESWKHSESGCIQYAESYGRTVTDELQLVSIVDDDASVRESLPDLLAIFGFAARVFSSAEEFLESGYVDKHGASSSTSPCLE